MLGKSLTLNAVLKVEFSEIGPYRYYDYYDEVDSQQERCQGDNHITDCLTDVLCPYLVLQKNKLVLDQQEDNLIDYLESLTSKSFEETDVSYVNNVENCNLKHDQELQAWFIKE